MPGLVLHTGPSSDLPAVPHSAANAVGALGAGVRLEVIVQGGRGGSPGPGTDLAGSLPGLLRDDVRILARENSMRSAGLEAADLAPGRNGSRRRRARAQRQWDGWAYIR
ncbi:hypothetical protein M8J71_15680 [Pseudarthrobacter sp. R1]|uniref:hypothetical protein n=1 Tax=Micrococcaceae TaxID=1268 RepID=UPI001112B587|nr:MULTISPECIES: hypothetical protein [Micrococcaceae]MCQ6271914.1 hypothetical protein [Pseudarthrobacter sp. R1]TNB69754.1 hypothetical protein FHJ30_17565 [Arthrobacter sp. BB-1]